MKTIFTISIRVFFSLLLFTGCKKEEATPQQTSVPAALPAVHNLKAFYEEQLSGAAARKKNYIPALGNPQWEKTQFSEKDNRYIVPVEMNILKSYEKFSIARYMVFSGEGNNISGDYYYIVTEGNHPQPGMQQVLQKIAAKERRLSSTAPVAHDVIKSPLIAMHEMKTVAGDYIDYRIIQPGDTGYSISTEAGKFMPADDCTASGGTMVQIDWFYQEYDHYGNVIYEHCVYSTWECWDGDGDGSGAGPFLFN